MEARDTRGECFSSDMMPFDYKTFCKQTYNVVRLVAISDTGKLEYGRFTVPSNCVCSYKKRANSSDLDQLSACHL
ncbi:hypothetical protein NQ318_009961 [Aromia moschata]|uniref:Spaetzle domain-containing protein n=1 Tax=Aromia moschata TaxID=1265417 RepID=A0AAV8X4R9_9CUCU|nr:hypothetical protein NQ318_009961 [Aromia moschata]